MKKIILSLFVAGIVCAEEYWGNCAPMLGIRTTNGEFKKTEPTFWKSACPTLDELYKGIRRYLEATNQTGRPYVIIEQEHGGYILHFTDE